jgi:hypothetical protein
MLMQKVFFCLPQLCIRDLIHLPQAQKDPMLHQLQEIRV